MPCASPSVWRYNILKCCIFSLHHKPKLTLCLRSRNSTCERFFLFHAPLLALQFSFSVHLTWLLLYASPLVIATPLAHTPRMLAGASELRKGWFLIDSPDTFHWCTYRGCPDDTWCRRAPCRTSALPPALNYPRWDNPPRLRVYRDMSMRTAPHRHSAAASYNGCPHTAGNWIRRIEPHGIHVSLDMATFGQWYNDYSLHIYSNWLLYTCILQILYRRRSPRHFASWHRRNWCETPPSQDLEHADHSDQAVHPFARISISCSCDDNSCNSTTQFSPLGILYKRHLSLSLVLIVAKFITIRLYLH